MIAAKPIVARQIINAFAVIQTNVPPPGQKFLRRTVCHTYNVNRLEALNTASNLYNVNSPKGYQGMTLSTIKVD